jgi:hypothetical protein
MSEKEIGGIPLTATNVSQGYFFERVHHFEEQYDMSWLEFLNKWGSEGSRASLLIEAGGQRHADFDEWAFICTNLMQDLLQQEAVEYECRQTSECFNGSDEKPDKSRASGFLGRGIVHFRGIRTIHRPSGERARALSLCPGN